MKNKKFNPLIFLMALGAGGISIIPFAFFQYVFYHGKGLVKYSDLGHGTLSLVNEVLFRSMEGVMIVFGLLHLVLMVVLVKGLVNWVRSGEYREFMENPLKNAAIVTPFIALIMSMNVFIGPVRYFSFWFASNLQVAMLPALIFWVIIWISLMWIEMELLKISFEKNFDVDKISFGWLLHPFALAMLTVTGTGIGAMAHDAVIAHVAIFMSAISGSMAVFLFVVKLIAIFKSHFVQDGLPEKQFLPSFLSVVPIVTLLAISVFRFGHYLEHQHGFHLGAYFLIVMMSAFAFESWYLVFGLFLLRDFFRKDFFRKEFYVTQWALVCPFVAYAVLGSFVYRVFVPSVFLYGLILIVTVFVVILFFILLTRQMKCFGILDGKGIRCL